MTLAFISASSVAVAQQGGGEKGAATIKKCQDANGTWHYGDFAAQECERTKITEINQRGITVKETAPLPTREELDAKKVEREKAKQEKKRLAAIRKEEQRLLSTYESLDAIVRARDDRVIAIDKEVATNEALKERLVKEDKHLAGAKDPKQNKRRKEVRDQIASFNEANERLTVERQEVIERYNALYMRYQTLVEQGSQAK